MGSRKSVEKHRSRGARLTGCATVKCKSELESRNQAERVGCFGQSARHGATNIESVGGHHR